MDYSNFEYLDGSLYQESRVLHYLRILGIHTVAELRGKNARELYERLCRKTEYCHDPKLISIFSRAIENADDYGRFFTEQKNNHYLSSLTP